MPVKAKIQVASRRYITRALPVGATIVCADNSGARTLKIIMVQVNKKFIGYSKIRKFQY